jgi:hypothetical protein
VCGHSRGDSSLPTPIDLTQENDNEFPITGVHKNGYSNTNIIDLSSPFRSKLISHHASMETARRKKKRARENTSRTGSIEESNENERKSTCKMSNQEISKYGNIVSKSSESTNHQHQTPLCLSSYFIYYD